MRNYPKLFAILKKNNLTKDDAALLGSSDRPPEKQTLSLRELTDQEFNALMIHMDKNYNQVPPGDLMRKAMIAMARQMRWYKPRAHRNDPMEVDMDRIDSWCEKYGQFKKPLMKHEPNELAAIVTTFQQVLNDFLISI